MKYERLKTKDDIYEIICIILLHLLYLYSVVSIRSGYFKYVVCSHVRVKPHTSSVSSALTRNLHPDVN